MNFDLIYKRLKELNLNLKQFGEKIQVPPSYLSAVKTGKKEASLLLIIRVSKFLQVHPLDICQVDYISDLLKDYPYNSKLKIQNS